jgi:peptidoglycan hydrolase-like protein with peptidoglycan-binding domain
MGQADLEDLDMAFASKTLAAVAFLALLPLGACATETVGGYGPVAAQSDQGAGAYGGAAVVQARLTPPESRDGLLSSPPNNARPGECYAKVVVPGQPVGAPPAQQRAVWVQTPPGPGQISPAWCIYYLPGAPSQPTAMTPERYGWIRVVCDKDATEDKIRHVQRRLHEWGDYDGAYDGHFDKVTAAGVVRFQEQRHIEHGGYLSVGTVEALGGAPPQGTFVPAFDAGRPNLNPPTIYPSSSYQVQAVQQAYPPTIQQTASIAPCGPVACAAPMPAPCPVACAAPPAPPQVIYAPPPPPQIIYRQSPPQVVVQRVIQPVYQQVYAPPPPPQVIYQQAPPQVVVQKVIQPVYQQVYAQAPQAACGQPACMPQPQPYPCGGPVCGAPGGQGWGGQGGGGQGWSGGYPQQAPAPYRALLTWPGKSTY